MGTTLGPKYIPYSYMEPLGNPQGAFSFGVLEQKLKQQRNWTMKWKLGFGRIMEIILNIGLACNQTLNLKPYTPKPCSSKLDSGSGSGNTWVSA